MLYKSIYKKDVGKRKQIIIKSKKNFKFKEKYFLKMKKLEDASSVFLALRSIYGHEVACDTATILLTHQLKGKRLSVDLLYDFLTARMTIKGNEKVFANHPYHVLLSDLIESAGVELKEIYHNRPKELPGSLPTSVGDTIVLINSTHMSIVTCKPYGEYEYSISGSEKGIHYQTNTLGRPRYDDFKGEIEQYGFIKKSQAKYRQTSSYPF